MNGGLLDVNLQVQDQDCGEFLLKFAGPGNVVSRCCGFEISLESRRECAEGHYPQEFEPSATESGICMQVKGCILGEMRDYTIQELIDEDLADSLSDLTPAVKRCKECVTRNEPDLYGGEGLCQHTYNPCSECCKQLNRLRSVRRFKTSPRILVIEVIRTRFTAYTTCKRRTKVRTPVRVDSIVTLQLCDGTVHEYQIVGIICHEGLSHDTGHYVGYIRCKGEWRLFDDS